MDSLISLNPFNKSALKGDFQTSQCELEEDKQHSGHPCLSLLTKGSSTNQHWLPGQPPRHCQRKSIPQPGKWGKSSSWCPGSWEAKKSELAGLQGHQRRAVGQLLWSTEAPPSSFLKKRFLPKIQPAKAKTGSHKLDSQFLNNLGENEETKTE